MSIHDTPDDGDLKLVATAKNYKCTLCKAKTNGTELCAECSSWSFHGGFHMLCDGCRSKGLGNGHERVDPRELDCPPQQLSQLHELSKTGAIILVKERCEHCETVETTTNGLFGSPDPATA